MSKSPIEIMIEQLDMTAVSVPQPSADDPLPYVTHEGELYVGECVFRVYQLSNGHRVLDAEDVHHYFGMIGKEPEQT